MEYLVRAARITDIERLADLCEVSARAADGSSPMDAASLLRQLVYLSDNSRYTVPLGLNAFIDQASGSSYGGMLAMSGQSGQPILPERLQQPVPPLAVSIIVNLDQRLVHE